MAGGAAVQSSSSVGVVGLGTSGTMFGSDSDVGDQMNLKPFCDEVGSLHEVLVEVRGEEHWALVTHFFCQEPDYLVRDSDLDYHGYCELDWVLVRADGSGYVDFDLTVEEAALVDRLVLESLEERDRRIAEEG